MKKETGGLILDIHSEWIEWKEIVLLLRIVCILTYAMIIDPDSAIYVGSEYRFSLCL